MNLFEIYFVKTLNQWSHAKTQNSDVLMANAYLWLLVVMEDLIAKTGLMNRDVVSILFENQQYSLTFKMVLWIC